MKVTSELAEIIKKICENIDTIDRLNNLYLLTVSDISAVDHGVWNDWKARLLKTLYTKIQSEILKPVKNKTSLDFSVPQISCVSHILTYTSLISNSSHF